MRYRYKFGEGILYIDLNDTKQDDPLKELHLAINRKKQVEMAKSIKIELASKLGSKLKAALVNKNTENINNKQSNSKDKRR